MPHFHWSFHLINNTQMTFESESADCPQKDGLFGPLDLTDGSRVLIGRERVLFSHRSAPMTAEESREALEEKQALSTPRIEVPRGPQGLVQ